VSRGDGTGAHPAWKALDLRPSSLSNSQIQPDPLPPERPGMIHFRCPSCNLPIRRKDSDVGQEFACVHCHHFGAIPNASQGEEEAGEVEPDSTLAADGPSLEGTAAVVSLLVIIAVAAALVASSVFGGGE
jgi:hypothetical protein